MSVPVAFVDQVRNLVKELNLFRAAKVQKGVEIFPTFALSLLSVETEQHSGRNAKALGKAHNYVQARLLLISLNSSPEIGRYLAAATSFLDGRAFDIAESPKPFGEQCAVVFDCH